MVSYTPFLNLAKPADGEPNWGSHINADLDILDEAFNDIADSFDKLNVVKLGGYPISLGPGVVGTGTARILIANDDTLSTTIVTNTGNQASASTSIASVFSSPLRTKILDDLDLQMGIDSRGVSIYNPVLNDVITPLYGYLTSSTGSYWDTGSGNVTPNTVRNVHASDDLATVSVESIDDEFGKTLTTATLPNSDVLKIGNIVLRDVCGIFTGVIDKPLYISLVQGATPLIFDFGSGNYSSNTLRTVSATNDPNLAAIKTASETLAAGTNQSGYSAPPTVLLGGRTIFRRGLPTGIPGVSTDTEIIRPFLGNDQGLYTHVRGGSVNAIIKDDNNETLATKQDPLFYRNSDVSSDRGQSSSKPFFNAITNPLVIGNGVNIVQLGGYAISRMRGIIGEGTQRVCIADDDTNLSRIVVLLDIIISLLDIIIEDEKPTYVVVSSVYGGSGVIAPPAMMVEEGDAATFYMVPSVGWQINAIRLDGQVQSGRSNMFIVPNVKADRTISVEFTELPEITHTITASAIGHGSIVPAGNITVGDGDNYVFNFVSDSGYRIASVAVDGTVISPDSYTNSFTFVGVTSDHTISVTYEAIPIATYTITASATGSGTISPAGANTYDAGASATYYISPLTGYSITSVLVDGSSVGTVSSYTFSNIYTNHTITASFGQNQYLIDTSVVGGNGSITPSKVATLGETVTVSFFPNSGYKLKTVTVDGAVVSVSTNSYTFSNISSPHRIVVEFEVIPQSTYQISSWVTNKMWGTGTNQRHPIGAEGLGTISPAGNNYYSQGASQTFTITPSLYRYIDDVKVDGVSVGKVSTYTFSNIQANHTIEFISARSIVEIAVTTDAYVSFSKTSGNAMSTTNPAQAAGTTVTYTVWMGDQWIGLHSVTSGHTLNSVKLNGTNISYPTNLTIGSSGGSGIQAKPIVNQTNTLVLSTGVNPAVNYTITASIGEGVGTVTPNAATVPKGGSSAFTIAPGSFHDIKSVIVDGASVGAVTSYNFTNVQANHAIIASFSPQSAGNVILAGGHGSSSGAYTNGIKYVTMETASNAYEYGSLSVAGVFAAAGTTTRAYAIRNSIETMLIATRGNSTNFGPVSGTSQAVAALSNNSRILYIKQDSYHYPYNSSCCHSVMSIHQFGAATTGQSSQYGTFESQVVPAYARSCCNSTYGYFILTESNSSVTCSTWKVTISTTGSATGPGLQFQREGMAVCSNSVRMIFAGGNAPLGSEHNVTSMLYATGSPLTEWGGLTARNRYATATCSATKALIVGGSRRGLISGAATTVNMETLTFSTGGYATSFGELGSYNENVGSTSNCHGGL